MVSGGFRFDDISGSDCLLGVPPIDHLRSQVFVFLTNLHVYRTQFLMDLFKDPILSCVCVYAYIYIFVHICAYQIECQIECWNLCQFGMPDKMPECVVCQIKCRVKCQIECKRRCQIVWVTYQSYCSFPFLFLSLQKIDPPPS